MPIFSAITNDLGHGLLSRASQVRILPGTLMPAGHGTAAAYERHGEWDGRGAAVEYLVTMTTRVPAGTSDAAVAEVRARESAHSRDLAEQGYLLRLWRPPLEPGEWRTLGLFSAENDEELETVLASMPLRIWRTDEVTPLSPHPNDPGVFVHVSE